MFTLEELKEKYPAKEQMKIRRIKGQIRDCSDSIEYYKRTIIECKNSLKRAKKDLSDLQRAKFLCGKFAVPKAMMRDAISRHRNIIASDTERIKYAENALNTYVDELVKLTDKLDSLQSEVRGLSDNKLKKLLDNINSIETIKQVKQINMINNALLVDTNDLTITPPVGKNKFHLGKMHIEIPFGLNSPTEGITMQASFYRNGYSPDMNHPHVWHNGTACWGNATNDIILSYNNENYYMLVLLIISFLETCDVRDEAGRFVACWPLIKEDGDLEDLTDGGDKKVVLNRDGTIGLAGYGHCDCCDCDVEEDDLYTCEDCGDIMCLECRYNLELWNGSYLDVCEHCYEEKYLQCEECGAYIHIDDVYKIDGQYVCPHCVETLYRYNPETAEYERIEEF